MIFSYLYNNGLIFVLKSSNIDLQGAPFIKFDPSGSFLLGIVLVSMLQILILTKLKFTKVINVTNYKANL